MTWRVQTQINQAYFLETSVFPIWFHQDIGWDRRTREGISPISDWYKGTYLELQKSAENVKKHSVSAISDETIRR